MKEPIQYSALCGQQTGVKGIGDSPAVPVHSFTQDRKALKGRRVEVSGYQKPEWALVRTRKYPKNPGKGLRAQETVV